MEGFASVALGGGLAGAVACTLLAIFVKSLNLGLLGNIATGLIVGGALSVALQSFGMDAWLKLALSIALCLAAMTAIGLFLNARAR